MEDAAAELIDTTAALDGDGEPAGSTVPTAVLQRRLLKARQEKDAEKADKEKLIKEKELLKKKWMRWQRSWRCPRQMLVTSFQSLLLPARYAGRHI